MKRRIFILLALIGFLAVLMPKQPVLALCNCYEPFSACLSNAVAANENCLSIAQYQYYDCISTSWSTACDDAYAMAAGACDNTFMSAENSCDDALESCLQGCGQGGGSSGGGNICNGDESMGYIVGAIDVYSEPLDACISEGGSVFTGYGWPRDTYDTCMSNLNNPELCCPAQVEALMDLWATCHLDSRNHSCKHCYSF